MQTGNNNHDLLWVLVLLEVRDGEERVISATPHRCLGDGSHPHSHDRRPLPLIRTGSLRTGAFFLPETQRDGGPVKDNHQKVHAVRKNTCLSDFLFIFLSSFAEDLPDTGSFSNQGPHPFCGERHRKSPFEPVDRVIDRAHQAVREVRFPLHIVNGVKARTPFSMKKNLILFSIVFVLFFLISILVLNQQVQSQVRNEVAETIKGDLDQCAASLEQHLEKHSRNVRFLAATPPIQGIIRATQNDGIDPYDQTPLTLWQDRLAVIFTSFLENNPDIAQIRYIGVADSGRELVRLDHKHGAIRRVPSHGLQKKGNEPFFKDTLLAPVGSVRISDLNLNREKGEIEYPIWPTLRFSVRIEDAIGETFGIVILNIDARPLLNSIGTGKKDNHLLYLVKSNGEYAYHPNRRAVFAKQLGEDIGFETEFSVPEESEEDTLSFMINLKERSRYLYEHHKVRLSNLGTNRYLKIILAIPGSQFNHAISTRLRSFILILGLVLTGCFFIIFVIHYYSAAALTQSETRATFEALVNSSSESIIAMDLDGAITSWNRAAVDMFGFTEMMVLGQPLWQIIAPRLHSDLNRQTIQQVADGQRIPIQNLTAMTRNGKSIEVDVTFSPIVSSEGTHGVAAIFRDVTEQRRAEAEIRHLNQSLEQQVRDRTQELETAHAHALAASEAKSAFVANVSHEIRTPLNGILGMLRLLKVDPLSSEQERYLLMAENSAHTLAGLINEVLDLSKIEAGKLTMDEISCDLLDVLSDFVRSMSISAQAKGLEFVADLADVTPNRIICDPHRLKQILTNLIGNAVKFTNSGEIAVSAATAFNHVGDITFECTVRDTGIGIAKDKIDLVFSEFTQEERGTTRQFGGTGLGLAICRKLVELMHGKIWLESTKGLGTTFHLVVKMQTTEGTHIKHKPLSLAGKRVLIVEDHGTSSKALQKLLTSLEAETTTFSRALEAEAYARRTAPDTYHFAVIDRSLPEYDGAILAAHLIKMNFLAPHQIFLAASLYSDHTLPENETAKQVIKITKPITPSELRYCLHKSELVANPASAAATTEETATVLPSPSPIPHRFKVLVVDDNQVNREVLNGLLKSFQVEVVLAKNGAEALYALQQSHQPPIHAVLMDCNMPIMDGYEATRQIRKGNAGSGMRTIPIIAVTANAMSGEKDICLQAGMNDYLSKPVDADLLQAKLARWVDITHTHDNQNGALVSTASALPESLRALTDVLDLKGALKNTSGDDSLLLHLINVFVDTIPEHIGAMKAAVYQKNYEQVYAVAHLMKGAAGTIGARSVEQLALQLCEETRKTDPSLNETQNLWRQFSEACSGLLERLSNFLHA